MKRFDIEVVDSWPGREEYAKAYADWYRFGIALFHHDHTESDSPTLGRMTYMYVTIPFTGRVLRIDIPRG